MKLIKQTLSSMPLVGWSPNANTIYIVTDKYGKIYVPVPSSQKFAFMHTRPTVYQGNLYLDLMLSDDIHIGGTSVGDRPVEVEFLTTESPYVVKFTSPTSTYIAMLYDSLDTITDVPVNSTVNPTAVCHAQGEMIKKMSPSHLWTFDEQYNTSVNSYYVDTVAYARLIVTDGYGIYPSAMNDLAYRMWYCPVGATGSAQVIHDTALTYYSIVLWVSAAGDCELLVTDKLSMHVTAGMLEITISGFTHTTAFDMVGTEYAPHAGVFPLHKVILVVEDTKVAIVINDSLAGIVNVPVGVDVELSPITPITIPESTVDRTYACIAIIPTHIPLEDITCSTLTLFDPPKRTIAVGASNCSVYSVRHWRGSTISGNNRLSISEIAEQGMVCIKVLASDDAVVSITYATNDVDGKAYFVPVKKDVLHHENIWIDKGGSLQVTVSPASATISAYSIGEH